MAGAAQLKGEMDRIYAEAEKLKENRGEEFAPEELAKIKTSLTEASGLIESNLIKEAIGKITEADNALKAASEKTYQRIAAERLEAAKSGLIKANESPAKEQFSDDIQKAAGLVDESRALYASKSYMASAEKSNEAIALLNTINISIEKKSEETRVAEGETKTEDREKLSAEGKELETGKEIPKEYVVRYNPKRRDCLWRISLQLYKDARLWPLIYIANRDKIKDPDLIFPGQRFVIPPVPKKLPPEKEAGKKEEKPDSAKE
jgi:nucleoid-associated protein YgaU